MIRYCILIVASTFIVACGKKGPVEPLEKSDYPRNYPRTSNPTSTPLEKPNMEDFHEVPHEDY